MSSERALDLREAEEDAFYEAAKEFYYAKHADADNEKFYAFLAEYERARARVLGNGDVRTLDLQATVDFLERYHEHAVRALKAALAQYKTEELEEAYRKGSEKATEEQVQNFVNYEREGMQDLKNTLHFLENGGHEVSLEVLRHEVRERRERELENLQLQKKWKDFNEAVKRPFF